MLVPKVRAQAMSQSRHALKASSGISADPGRWPWFEKQPSDNGLVSFRPGMSRRTGMMENPPGRAAGALHCFLPPGFIPHAEQGGPGESPGIQMQLVQ